MQWGEIYARSIRVVIEVRAMRFSNAPDQRANPGDRAGNHIQHRAQHENVEWAVFVA